MPFDVGQFIQGVPAQLQTLSRGVAGGLGNFLGDLQNLVRPQEWHSGLPTRSVDTEHGFKSMPKKPQSEMVKDLGSKLKMDEQKSEKTEEKAQMTNITITSPTQEGGKVTIKVDQPKPEPTPTIIPEFQGVNKPFQAQIADLLTQAGLADQVNNFINLSARESSLNPNIAPNVNPYTPAAGRSTADWGPFQFNDFYQEPLMNELGLQFQDLNDPVAAINAMIELYRRRGYKDHPATAPGLGL